MKKYRWRRLHKWLGIFLAFFIIMFALSGLILNHSRYFSNIEISRRWLPSSYQYKNWDKGLVRGTISWKNKIIIYGNNGLWLTDSTSSYVRDLNKGLPVGTDNRQIRRVLQTRQGKVFALSTYELYLLDESNNTWHRVDMHRNSDERLSDIESIGDSLIVTSRSYIYISSSPYQTFKKLLLRPANDNDNKVSLFRSIWLLHSGELFGIVGKLIVDLIAIILIFLSTTGIACWILPKFHYRKFKEIILLNISWHNTIGKISIFFTLFICITGWMLRPPALIAIAKGKIPPIPFSTLDSPNSWNDKFQTLRYDTKKHDWLLCTSDGFYSLSSIYASPKRIKLQPNISVMGINVETQNTKGQWLIGSFSGMYIWDRRKQKIIDYYTKKLVKQSNGIPFGENAVVGYTSDFNKVPFVIKYKDGASFMTMPKNMSFLPISLRYLCIEIHTGRIYTFIGKANILYIFFIGIFIIWCIISGWKIKKIVR